MAPAEIKVEGPDGKELIQRKTLVQEFWRPGDEFDQNEQEIRVVETPKWANFWG